MILTLFVNDSLGGVTKFIVDPATHKITGYTTKGGADTVFPFKGNPLTWLKNIPDEDDYFLVHIHGQGGSYYLIDTNGYSNLHIEHYAGGKAVNIRIYDTPEENTQISIVSIDGAIFDISSRNDVIALRFWGGAYGVYKIYVS